ncbi:MAG: DNA polymerase III subunit delta [Patescibacteria group bacterium]|nr:DNA polymerase III subunit delta [Patescibacteria group bacterium]
MIIFLYGEDTFRSKQKLKEFKNKFTKDIDSSQINIVDIDGEKLDLESFKQTILSGGFLVKKRMIIIENLLEKNKGKEILKEILALLKNKNSPVLASENIIIFWEKIGTIRADKYKGKILAGPLFNFLKKEKYSFEFPLLNNSQLFSWIKKQTENRKKNIDSEAINSLISLVGNDLWQISNELDKLSAYKEKDISAEDVKEIVSNQFNETIFGLIDAIVSKNKKLSFQLLSKHFMAGAEPSFLLTMLIRQFKMIIRTKDLLEKNPNANLAIELKAHPFVAQKVKIQATKYSLLELKNIYSHLLAIDIKLKQGYSNHKLLFSDFILNSVLANNQKNI